MVNKVEIHEKMPGNEDDVDSIHYLYEHLITKKVKNI